MLTLAFALAATGTAVGLALAGRSDGTHAATGSSSTQIQPAQVAPANTTSTTSAPVTSPAASTSSPATTSPASTPATTPATTPASTAAQLPALVVGSYSGSKPTEIAYSGDATNVVTKITWASWAATGATGTGTSDIDSCIPNCATAPTNYVTTTITLSTPANGHFTQMTETRNGSTTNYTYPATWAQSATWAGHPSASMPGRWRVCAPGLPVE